MQESRPSTIKPAGPNRAMKLGSKAKDVDSFVDQLKSEGERVVSSTEPQSPVTPTNTPAVDMESWVGVEMCLLYILFSTCFSPPPPPPY